MCDESVILGELSMLGRRLWVARVAEMSEISMRKLCFVGFKLFYLNISYTNTLKL